MSRESQNPIIYSIFNSMKFYRSLFPYLVVLLMVVASFANEPDKMEDAEVHTSGSRFEPIPWNMFIGGLDGFVVGVFFDLFNLEMEHLVNSGRTYINFIFNLPTGLGIWV